MLFRIFTIGTFFLGFFPVFFIPSTLAQCTVRATVQHATCNGKPDGAIQLQVTGTSPYKFKWNTGETTQNLTGLMAGTYTVEVTDGKGSVGKASVVVQSRTSLQIELNQTASTLTVHITGGAIPYQYHLNKIDTPQTVSTTQNADGIFHNLAPGRYALAVTDANGCVVVKAATIR